MCRGPGGRDIFQAEVATEPVHSHLRSRCTRTDSDGQGDNTYLFQASPERNRFSHNAMRNSREVLLTESVLLESLCGHCSNKADHLSPPWTIPVHSYLFVERRVDEDLFLPIFLANRHIRLLSRLKCLVLLKSGPSRFTRSMKARGTRRRKGR